MTGYLSSDYPKAFEELATPHLLLKSQGWILKRQIPGFLDWDGMGCYPIFSCQHWELLSEDLDNLKHLVSLAVVADPFGDFGVETLTKCFPDKVIPFKEHFVVDLSFPLSSFVHPHHCRYARKALGVVRVENCQQPLQFSQPWIELYKNLIERHNIRNITAFSSASFIQQLKVPGLVMFRAIHEETSVGISLWYVQNRVGYYHLGAYSELGYQLRASFALFWYALEYFAKNQLKWLNLGAGSGLKENEEDGLTRFKKGWSTGTRTAYFCGRIFDRQRYQEIVAAKGMQPNEYFPAYRQGEFA